VISFTTVTEFVYNISCHDARFQLTGPKIQLLNVCVCVEEGVNEVL
jgi:hypothetical protein